MLVHRLPAHVLDSLFRLVGKKPFLNRLYDKIDKATAALNYFTTNDWTWGESNLGHLEGAMHEFDRREFNFDVSELNWDLYMETYVQGVRKFVLKNDDDSLGQCRRKLFYYKMAHYSLQLVGSCVVFGLFWLGLGLVLN